MSDTLTEIRREDGPDEAMQKEGGPVIADGDSGLSKAYSIGEEVSRRRFLKWGVASGVFLALNGPGLVNLVKSNVKKLEASDSELIFEISRLLASGQISQEDNVALFLQDGTNFADTYQTVAKMASHMARLRGEATTTDIIVSVADNISAEDEQRVVEKIKASMPYPHGVNIVISRQPISNSGAEIMAMARGGVDEGYSFFISVAGNEALALRLEAKLQKVNALVRPTDDFDYVVYNQGTSGLGEATLDAVSHQVNAAGDVAFKDGFEGSGVYNALARFKWWVLGVLK